MAKPKRTMIPCATCGNLIIKPVLLSITEPTCFPCKYEEMRAASAESK